MSDIIIFDRAEGNSVQVNPYSTNGLGRLTLVSKCLVTEELNGAYEMTLDVSVKDEHFCDLVVGRQLLVQVSDGTMQPFRIDQITKPMKGTVSVHAYHKCYDMTRNVLIPSLGYYQPPVTMFNAMKASYVVGDCPFVMESSITALAAFNNTEPVSLKAVLGDGDESFAKIFGGEFEWDVNTIRFSPHRGSSDPVASIRYGKNLTGITASEEGTPYASIVPYATGNDGNVVTGDVQTASGHTVNEGVVPVDVSEYLTDGQKAELTKVIVNAAGAQWLADEEPWRTTKELKVQFVQTSELDRVYLGDNVVVIYEDFGIEETLRIVKTVWDAVLGRYNSVDIGMPERTITKKMAKQEVQTSAGIASAQDMSYNIANGQFEGGSFISGKSAKIEGGSLAIGPKTAPDSGWHFVVDADGNVTMDGGITLNGAITWGQDATGKPPMDSDDIFDIMEDGETYITRDGLFSPSIIAETIAVFSDSGEGKFELHRKDSLDQDEVVGYIGQTNNNGVASIAMFYRGTAAGEISPNDNYIECTIDGVRMSSYENRIEVNGNHALMRYGQHTLEITSSGIYADGRQI